MNESGHRPPHPAARWWQAGIAIVIAGSLVIQLVLVFNGGADANSGDTGESVSLGVRLLRLFSYFTIQSNLIVLAAAIMLAWRPRFDSPVWRVVRLDSLLGIVITGLVYAIVLAPQVHLTGAAEVATIGFHYISPWAALAGWLLFGPRPRMTWATVGAAFGWPLLWLVYTFVHGALSGWYPYPFLDVVEIGLGAAIRNAFVVLVIGVMLALAFKALDAKLPMLRVGAGAAQRPSTDSSHSE